MNRRKFFAAIGSVPLIAKHIGTKTAVSSGISAMGSDTDIRIKNITIPTKGMGAIKLSPSINTSELWIKAIAAGLTTKEELRDYLKTHTSPPEYVQLDPDLLASKSLSLSAKYRIQEERRIDKLVEEKLKPPSVDLIKQLYDKVYPITFSG